MRCDVELCARVWMLVRGCGCAAKRAWDEREERILRSEQYERAMGTCTYQSVKPGSTTGLDWSGPDWSARKG